jgi:hypothetical protein
MRDSVALASSRRFSLSFSCRIRSAPTARARSRQPSAEALAGILDAGGTTAKPKSLRDASATRGMVTVPRPPERVAIRIGPPRLF